MKPPRAKRDKKQEQKQEKKGAAASEKRTEDPLKSCALDGDVHEEFELVKGGETTRYVRAASHLAEMISWVLPDCTTYLTMVPYSPSSHVRNSPPDRLPGVSVFQIHFRVFPSYTGCNSIYRIIIIYHLIL